LANKTGFRLTQKSGASTYEFEMPLAGFCCSWSWALCVKK